MLTHLLDTSAVLAHRQGERGSDIVQALFDDKSNRLGICVVTILEFHMRLHVLGLNEAEREAEVARYTTLFDLIVPVTKSVCAIAVRLKLGSTSRLPSIDSLIAASAQFHDATLVHRDPHFLSVPATLLRQELLPEK